MSSSSFPLFERFPSLRAAFPRFEILNEPTPVQTLRSRGFRVKRDDRSENLLGGNKARKLELILPALALAPEPEQMELSTVGMLGSNHALATAAAVRQFLPGRKLSLLLGPQPVSSKVRQKLLAFHCLGADLKRYRTAPGLGLGILRRSRLDRSRRGWIAPGGSSIAGMVGYVNAFFELWHQLGDQMPKHLVLPTGTGGTATGLLVGAYLSGQCPEIRIHAVGVTSPWYCNGKTIRSSARRLYHALLSRMSPEDLKSVPELDWPRAEAMLEYSSSYYRPGYGVAEAHVHGIVRDFEARESLSLEATYTGKAMKYLLDKDELWQRHALFWLTYNSFSLDGLIRSHPWENPERKWRDLPRDFWDLFESQIKAEELL